MNDSLETAFDAVGRGFATLRANWQLVPAMWLQQVLVLVLFLLGAAVPLVALGIDPFGGGWLEPQRWAAALDAWQPTTLAEAAEDLALVVEPVALPLAVALLGTLVVWTLAVVVFCWFQGGFFGVLLAAERQAPPGPPRDWRLFRTWDRALFVAWARRLAWRYFGFWNLWGLFLLAWLAGALAVVWAARAAAVAAEEAGLAAVGCGGALLLAAALLVLGVWSVVTPPELAREEGAVGRSSRHALGFMARHPLALGLVLAVFVALSLLVGMALGSVGTPFVLLLLQGSVAPWLAVQAVVTLLQIGAGMVVSTAMNGALAALLVADGRQAAARPAVAAAAGGWLGEVRP